MSAPVRLLCSLGLVTVPAHAGSTDELAVGQALHVLCAAFERGDADYLERELDPRFTLTGSNGTVTTREQEAAELRSGKVVYDVFRNRCACTAPAPW